MLHAPEFLVYSKKFTLKLTDDTEVTFNLDNQTIRIDTALGLPSLIMLYTEFAELKKGAHELIHGAHPRIGTLRIQLFNQDVPIVQNLNTDELRYITQKNSHPNYMKDTREQIVLLDLESLGLGKDLPGYPSRDRVNAEISLTTITLPGVPRKQFATDAEDQAHADIELEIEFKCVFIYENRVVEGNVNQMKINRKY